MPEPREEFEEATEKILELTGYAMITGMTMACLYRKEVGKNMMENYYNNFRESFNEYIIEAMPHMDAYLIRKDNARTD